MRQVYKLIAMPGRKNLEEKDAPSEKKQQERETKGEFVIQMGPVLVVRSGHSWLIW
jgi:hypothetical protein